MTKKLFSILVFIFILSAYILSLTRKIDLTISDLGRHLKNGELFFANFYIPGVNVYSYTFPDFHFINHHWASGLVFFIVKRFSGFEGLSVFFILLSLTTFLLFFRTAWKYSRFEIAALVSLFAIPNIVSRPEIRPEVFSYLLSGIFFWVLWECKNGRLKWRWIFLLPVLELLWVNLHVYFFIGLVLIGVFLLEYLARFYIQKKEEAGAPLKKLAITLGVSVLAAFINPSGASAVFYPLNIFGNYGLDIFENQSVFALERTTKAAGLTFLPLFYFKLAFGLFITTWILLIVKVIRKRINFPFVLFGVSVIFSLMALLATRNLAIFAYFFLVVTAINLGCIIKTEFSSGRDYLLFTLLFILISADIFLARPAYWRRGADFGLGLKKGNSAAIDFFRKERIQGPILNNYDIGGYLIYYLYPEYRVFVDNRPEAYPSDFLKKTYVTLQSDEGVWQRVSALYGFNVIFFNPHVRTPWGQDFLMRRITEPLWAAVYVDDLCIILLRRNGPNQETIRKYELAPVMFLPQKDK